MIVAVKNQKQYKNKIAVDELLKSFMNRQISQEVLEARLKKLKVGKIIKYLT